MAWLCCRPGVTAVHTRSNPLTRLCRTVCLLNTAYASISPKGVMLWSLVCRLQVSFAAWAWLLDSPRLFLLGSRVDPVAHVSRCPRSPSRSLSAHLHLPLWRVCVRPCQSVLIQTYTYFYAYLTFPCRRGTSGKPQQFYGSSRLNAAQRWNSSRPRTKTPSATKPSIRVGTWMWNPTRLIPVRCCLSFWFGVMHGTSCGCAFLET